MRKSLEFLNGYQYYLHTLLLMITIIIVIIVFIIIILSTSIILITMGCLLGILRKDCISNCNFQGRGVAFQLKGLGMAHVDREFRFLHGPLHGANGKENGNYYKGLYRV